MLIASHRSSVGLVSVFFFLTIAFILLTAEHFVANPIPLKQAGGIFGLITAFLAWYVAAAGLLTPDTSYFTLPVGSLARRD